ncbi:MAG: Carboxyvinyl-carboxyphosphonate phosphorylmutase, partial [Sphingomonas bacterium]|nr:Carboxyvinyl-carboxyphosphonate phosphorylmutase [Sphingomonas bacterium]
IGVDAVLVPGVPDLDGYRRLRDAVTVPIFVVVVPGSPWFAPTIADLKSIGIEAALYPAALLTRVIAAVTAGLGAIRATNGAPPQGFDMASVGRLLRSADWAAIDQRFGGRSEA